MTDQFAATAKIVEDVVARSQQALEDLVKASQDQAAKAGKTVEEITDLNRKNVEAVIEATRIFARGIEDAGAAVTAYSKKTTEASLASLRKLAAAGSVTEAAEIQQSYAKESVNALVSETERLQSLVSGTARAALAPLNERVNAAVEMMSRPLAA
ncbi:MAG: phasin family protein [Rhodospirillaceae bacterium]